MLRRTIGGIGKAQPNAAVLIQPWQSGRAQLPDQSYETLYRDGYAKNEIVFGCITEWMTDIAEAELRAYRNTPNGPEVVEDHPVVQLWNNPNPWLSGDELATGQEMFKKLAGNTYILKVRSAAGKVVELWLLRPDRMKVIPDKDTFIGGYEYRNGAESVKIPAEDVIHLKEMHPFNDWYGMAPLMAASGRVDIDNFMRDIVKGFLRNSGVPAGVLRIQGQISEQEKSLFRNRFRTDYGGENAGNVMIVSGGKDAAEFTPLAMSLGARGLVIPELDEIDEARIAMVFHVPPSILNSRIGMNSSSYGNRKSDREEFTQRQLVPEWQYIASTLNRALLPEFGGADFLAYDLTTVQALRQDQDALSARIRAEVQCGIRSVEEGRRALGLLAEPNDGETFYVPNNFIPTPANQLDTGQVPALPAPQMPAEAAPPTRSYRPEVIVVNVPRQAVRKRLEYDDQGRPVGTVEEPIDD